jgi:hypothetical protein
MTLVGRAAGLALVMGVLAAGCQRDTSLASSPLPTGTVSSEEVQARLCERPAPRRVARERAGDPIGDAPPVVAELMAEVEEVRGLDFLHPVDVEAVTREEMAGRIREAGEATYPEGMYARRSLAWQTIGVLPEGVDLREAYITYGAEQVVGFYDPARKELVYIGSEDPSSMERLTLAHELTHALDDQHFDLVRLNELESSCRDEELEAALGAVEGSAQLFSSLVAAGFDLGDEDLEEALTAGTDVPAGAIPGFLQELALWPYLHGQQFMAALNAHGGLERVNEALDELPASAEQIIHPELYGKDEPRPVDVPDLGPALGPDWEDLDAYPVGEHWLSAALRLRISQEQGIEAAAGWDGGEYRAWTDGPQVAVVLITLWDSLRDAVEFARAAEQWLEPENSYTTDVLAAREAVAMLWAPNEEVLDRLRRGLS